MQTDKITYHIEERDLRRALSSFKRIYYRSRPGLCALFLPGLLMAVISLINNWHNINDQLTSYNFNYILGYIVALTTITFLIWTIVMLSVAFLRIWVFPFFAARRQYDDNMLIRNEHSVKWNEEKIALKDASGISIIPWNRFYRVVERRQQFLLMFDEREFLFLPKHAFDAESLYDLRCIIAPYKNRKKRFTPY